MRGTRAAGRIGIVTTVTAALLVPSLTAPARTIYRPQTLARAALLSPGAPVARFSFLPTHIAFSWRGDEGTGVRYRTTGASGRLSKWRRATEAHDAERGDRHFSAVLSVARPVTVEYEPVRPRGAAMSAVTIDYLNTVDGPVRAFRVPVVANAAASEPTIVTRREWGADESLKRTSGGCKRRFFNLQQLFVHHTAGKNYDTKPAATMRAIYWYHTQRQGWCDLGYNFVIAPDGRIFEGRWARRYAPWEVHSSENLKGKAVAGAHVSGFNSGSVGVSVMGNYSLVKPSPAVRRTLAEVLAWEADRHGLDPQGRHFYRNPETGMTKRLKVIAGHRAAGSTECPGTYLGRALRGVRRDTAAVMGDGKAESVLTLGAARTEVTAGESVDFSGRLADGLGIGLVSRPVTIYQRVAGGSWAIATEVVTGLDGGFSFTLAPPATIRVRAVYDGNQDTWGSQSANVRVRVSESPSPSPSPTSTSQL